LAARARNLALKLRAPFVVLFARKEVRAAIDWLAEPVLAVVLVFSATTVIAQPFYVPSGSMQPTLAIGDLTLATKFNYGYSIYSIPYMNGPTPSGRFLGGLPKGRRRGRIPPAESYERHLCQTRDRPARRPHPDARRPAVDQRARAAVAPGGERPRRKRSR